MLITQDMIGQNMLPGDIVAYPSRHGSYLCMNSGKVVEVKNKKTRQVQW